MPVDDKFRQSVEHTCVAAFGRNEGWGRERGIW